MEAQLFEAQRKEFIDHTQLFHEKMKKMYLSTMENESFDAKLHVLWDQWDLSQRCSFLQQAWNQFVFIFITRIFYQVEIKLKIPD